jgi:hypothetical protein
MKDIQGALYGLLTTAALSGTDPALLQTDIYFNDSLDTAPKDRLFAIIRMGTWDIYNSKGTLARRNFSVWVHAPLREWPDHSVTRAVLLQRVVPILLGATQVAGSDGTLTSCCLSGISGDLTDSGYQTITNNAVFEAGVL